MAALEGPSREHKGSMGEEPELVGLSWPRFGEMAFKSKEPLTSLLDIIWP